MRAAELVLAAAARTGPPGGRGPTQGPDGPAEGEHAGHAWRDAAVLCAVADAWAAGDGDGVRALADGYGALMLHAPALEDGVVVLRRVGIGERRRRGAFATPGPLARALVARAVPQPVRTVVDPACGPGALLRAVFARLLRLGETPARALDALHGVDLDPVAVAVCRAVLAVEAGDAGHACSPADLAGRVVVGDALRDAAAGQPGGGFAWAAAFPTILGGAEPDPVTGWGGGFDAVVANPPWERLKVLAKDWTAAPDGLRRNRAEAARGVRTDGRHPLTGAGEINAYLPFVETSWRLLAPQGRAALVVPAGIASDRSAGRLLTALVAAGCLGRVVLLDRAAGTFEGVSDRVAVALVDLRGRGAPVAAAEVTVGVADPHDVPASRTWRLTADVLRRVNPNSGTLPVSPGPREADLLARAHERWPVLLRRDAGGEVTDDPWGLRTVTPLHMTRDARFFADVPGPGLVPLWEAKHAGLLDHLGGGTRAPRYWVDERLMAERFPDLWRRGWLAGYRNVTTSTSARTLLPVALPRVAVGNSLPLLSAPRLPLLLAGLASLPVDFLTRCKHAGANLNFFKLEQVPLPRPETYDAPAPWEPGTSVADWLLDRLRRAVVWGPGLEGLAAELGAGRGGSGPAPGEDAGQVARQRDLALAEIDAAHAVLLGWGRGDLETVLATFPALRARDERDHGRFVTAERVLAAFERLDP